MEKKLAGVVDFFEKILPQAQFGSHWDELSISRGIAWARVCQKIYSNLTSDCSSTRYSSENLCKCNGDVVPNIDTTTLVTLQHRKTFSFPTDDLVTGSSVCKKCGLRKHVISADGTVKAKSVWQKKEIASAVLSVVKDSGYNFCQMDDSVVQFMSKLLLNKELSVEQQDMVREAVDKELKEEEKKDLWLMVDQVKANEEHLRILVEGFGEGSFAGTLDGVLLQEGIKSTLKDAIRCNQLDMWMKNHLKRDKLLLNTQKDVKCGHSLRAPNFLYRLLWAVSTEEDIGLSVLKWVTQVHRDAGHDCHALLLNQWLSLFWFKQTVSNCTNTNRREKCFRNFQQPELLQPSCPLIKTSLVQFMDLNSCFCKAVTTLLTSLLTALFEACALGLQCRDNDTNLEPKWLLKGTNCKGEPSPLNVVHFIKVSGVNIPALMSVDNLAHLFHVLANCSATDGYSGCTCVSFRRSYYDLESQESKKQESNSIGYYHAKIRSILKKAFTIFACSPQGSLWAEVKQKSESLF